MENDIRCDIIIPTYNGSSHLPNLLRSIEKQSFQSFNCFVIDDNSSDNTVDILGEDFSWVHVIKQSENMGPSHNRNVAIQAGDSPYIVIFDDDTYLDDTEWLERAIIFMEANHDVGQLAAMIVNGFEPEIILDCGIVQNWYLFGGTFYNIRVDDTQGRHEKGRVVLGACSAGTVLRRELFNTIGGFDAKYYYPVEDTDLSLRIHVAGYKVWYEPSLKVFHYESQAMGKSLDRKMYLYRRNCLLVLIENYPVTHVCGMYWAMLSREVVKPTLKYMFNVLTGRNKEPFPSSIKHYLKALMFLFGKIPQIMKKRSDSERFRKHPRKYLVQVNRALIKDLAG